MTFQELEASLQNRWLPHAVLVTGGAADSRLQAARRIAQAAVCTGSRPLCGQCRNCRKALSNIHPDISFWEREPDDREIKVDKIRALRAAAQVTPNEAPRSVFVVPEADTMNEQGQNALLKTLEEPPETAVLVLLAENPERLLPTVRSRCAMARLSAEAAEEDPELRAEAQALLRAYRADDHRAMLECVLPWEKKSRQEMTEFFAVLRRLAVADPWDPAALLRLTDVLAEGEKYLGQNVSASHVAGLLLAALVG